MWRTIKRILKTEVATPVILTPEEIEVKKTEEKLYRKKVIKNLKNIKRRNARELTACKKTLGPLTNTRPPAPVPPYPLTRNTWTPYYEEIPRKDNGNNINFDDCP